MHMQHVATSPTNLTTQPFDTVATTSNDVWKSETHAAHTPFGKHTDGMWSGYRHQKANELAGPITGHGYKHKKLKELTGKITDEVAACTMK